MSAAPIFQEDLIHRYDTPGPRYSSYPPATEFHDGIGEDDYRKWARLSNEELIPKPLSLYFHIPFCSSICHYCACNKIITGQREEAEPYLQDLHREIEIQSELFDRDREVRQLHWGGGTPGFLTHEQSERLMEQIAARFRLLRDGGGEYSIEIDPRVLAKGGVAHLRNLGFNRISIGVQDFDETVQKAVNRVQSFEVTARVVAEARRHGIRSINVDLIYGLPHQTARSFAASLDRVIDLDPDRIAIYNYAHLPHRYPPQRQIRAEDLPETREKLEILRRAIDKLDSAGYEYIGMDHFAKPDDELAVAQRNRRLHRNFQGYSAHPQCDSIGFGISAISHVNDNFSQHTTSIDSYHDSLERQQLPVIRGFESDAEDLLRREIIHSLACHFRLDTRELSRQWDIDFEEKFAAELRRLDRMQRDGLLQIGSDEIRICEPGRLLVRNICMVFDRYQQPEKATGLFSHTL